MRIHNIKCMSILLYRQEALPLSKSQQSSLDFMLNSFLMKLFTSNDMQRSLTSAVDFKLSSEQLDIVARNLLVLNL